MTLEEFKALEEKQGKPDTWMLWGPTVHHEEPDPFGEELEELTEEEREEIEKLLEDDEDDEDDKEEETSRKSRLDLPADGHLPESPKYDDGDEWDGEPRDDVETM